jgi:hypothetical protein
VWAIPVTLLAFRAVNPMPYRSSTRHVILAVLAAAVVVVMTLTKPNFTLIMLPGIGLFALYRIVRRQRVDWPLLLGIGAPAILLLGYQFFSPYNSHADSSIVLGPSGFMLYYSLPWQIVLQFLGSIAFPLAVYLLNLNRARLSPFFNLAWLIFLSGALFAYFVYEDGIRTTHGNFTWGAYAALFVLMYAAVIFLIRNQPEIFSVRSVRSLLALSRRQHLLLVILGLHVICAVAYWNAVRALAAAGIGF